MASSDAGRHERSRSENTVSRSRDCRVSAPQYFVDAALLAESPVFLKFLMKKCEGLKIPGQWQNDQRAFFAKCKGIQGTAKYRGGQTGGGSDIVSLRFSRAGVDTSAVD
jgi:hypothetical protein